MKGRIIEAKEIRIVGIEVDVELQKGEDLTRAWENYVEVLIELDEIKNLKTSYGYGKNFNLSEDRLEFKYLMGMEERDYDMIPLGFTEWTLPAGRYISYTYKGKVSPKKIEGFNRKIYEEWLSEDGVECTRNESIEYYGSKYKHGEEDSEFEIWIPIS